MWHDNLARNRKSPLVGRLEVPSEACEWCVLRTFARMTISYIPILISPLRYMQRGFGWILCKVIMQHYPFFMLRLMPVYGESNRAHNWA